MNNIKIKCDKLPKIDVFVDGVNISNKDHIIHTDLQRV